MGRKIEEKVRYKRKRRINPVILIVSEGRKTEPQYFSKFKNRYTNIIVPTDNSRSSKKDYKHLIEKTLKYKKNNDLSHEDGDIIWCVFDGDVDYNTPNSIEARNRNLKEVIKTAKEHSIKIALSSPCFEMWYILHYEYTTKCFSSSKNTKAYLKKWIEGYSESKDVFNILKPLTSIAIENGKKLMQHHKKNGNNNLLDVSISPYTNVWELIEEIQNLTQGSL